MSPTGDDRSSSSRSATISRIGRAPARSERRADDRADARRGRDVGLRRWSSPSSCDSWTDVRLSRHLQSRSRRSRQPVTTRSYTKVLAWLVDGRRVVAVDIPEPPHRTSRHPLEPGCVTVGTRPDALVATGHGFTVRMADRPRVAAAVPAALRARRRRARPRRARRAVRSRRHRRRHARTHRTLPDYLESMRNLPRSFTARACTCSPTRSSSSTPGADTAHLDTYAVVYQTGPVSGDGGDLTLGMRYVDDMVRRPGTEAASWCIHHRVARCVWMRSLADDRSAPGDRAARAGGLAVEDGDLAVDDRGPEADRPAARAACRRRGGR